MANDVSKAQLIELLRNDADVRRALLEGLAHDISAVADLMRRAHDTYPLRLR